MRVVDSHCHLDFPDFDDDRDAVVARARAAGVEVMQTISTRLAGVARVREIARAYDGVYCAVGVHPHNVAEEGVPALADLLAHADAPEVIGIGETGLDYFYEHSPRAAQREAFAVHIAAARESGLPLIVHTREADDDTIRMLTEAYAAAPFRGLIHCFSTARAVAEAALDIGFAISISGIVTFKKATALREIVRTLPLDRLLIETDAPYLAPVPMRGRRNEPAFVLHTAAAIADIKGITVAEVARATTETFFTLFGKAAGDVSACAS